MTDLLRRKAGKLLGALAVVPVVGLPGLASADSGQSAERDKPLVDHRTTTAKALAYMASSDKNNQSCSNCAAFTANTGSETGDCPLFVSHRVGAKAWCSAWTEKA